MPAAHSRTVRLFLFLLVLTVLASPGCDNNLLTGGGDDGGKGNWAVLVGVSQYQVPSFNLKYADDDALDYFDALVRGTNWSPSNINVLLNSAATKSAIAAAIASTGSRMSSGDKFVLFYSGHGTTGPDQPPIDEAGGVEAYLAPYDALSNSYANDISDDELESWLSALPTSNVLVVLDASFSGGFIRGRTMAGARVKFIDRGMTPVQPRGISGMTRDLVRSGYIVQTASAANESPIESSVLQNGVFTYYLVEGLLGAANPDGDSISAQQDFQYAAPRATAFYSGQHPQQQDSRGSPFLLVVK